MSTPEELLAQILKANKKIAFGQTIGTNADGNCTVQTEDGLILARSPDQISAGSAIALKSDDGQWYAVSARQTGSVQRSRLYRTKNKIDTLEETLPLKILFSFGNDLFVGGDRDSPENIYTIPSGFEIEEANISTSGAEADDWVVQIVLRSTAVMDAYRLSLLDGTALERENNSFFLFYLNNRAVFEDSLRLITITPDDTKEIKDRGIKTFRSGSAPSFTFTCERFINAKRFQTAGSSNLNFRIRETYSVNTADWSFTPIRKTCDIWGSRDLIISGGSNTVVIQEDVKLIAEDIRLAILAGSSPLYFWKVLSDTGISDTYQGFTLTLDSSSESLPSNGTPRINMGEWLLLNVEIAGFGWWYSFDAVSLSFPVEATEPSMTEPYVWREVLNGPELLVDPDGTFTRKGASIFSYSEGAFGSFPFSSLPLPNVLQWLGFFCGFDGKSDIEALPLTIPILSISNQTNIGSLPVDQRFSSVDINVSPSRSFRYTASLSSGFSSLYSYPLSKIDPNTFTSSFNVFSFQKDSYIVQGIGEETQLIKTSANNIGSLQLFDLYIGGETKIVACPFRAEQLNGEVIFGSFSVVPNALTFALKGYELDGIIIPPEIEDNGVMSKFQSIKSLGDVDIVWSASAFLDIDSYNDLPDTEIA